MITEEKPTFGASIKYLNELQNENEFSKIICKPNFVFKLDFLEAYHIHKNHNNVVNCDFAIPPLTDFWKSYIKSNFS